MKNVELSLDKKTVTTTITEPRRINIVPDESPESPREWDNLGTFLAFHKRYDLNEDENCPCDVWNFDKEEVDAYLKEITDAGGYVCDLYMYDHSGIALSTSPFNCRFDSGKLGAVIVSKEKLDEEKLDANVKSDREKIRKIIDFEIETYNQYASGDVFQIIDNANEIECGCFFGYETAVSEIESYGLTEFLDKTYNG